MTFGTAVAQAEIEDREIDGAYVRLAFGLAGRRPGRGGRGHDPARAAARPAWRWWPTPTTSGTPALFGTMATTPLFGVPVPILAHRLADPEKGTGIAMVCTFGDTTDVTWWRDLQLDTRAGDRPGRAAAARSRRPA